MAKEMSRKWLEALGLEADKIDVIVEAHSGIIQAVKDERDAAVKAREEVTEELNKIDRTKDWKKLYEDELVANNKRNERAAKETALRDAYKQAGIPEKYHGRLLKIADYDAIELGEDGKAKNTDTLVNNAKSEYSDFIPVPVVANNQQTPTPPVVPQIDFDSMNDADYYKATYAARKE